VSEILDFSTMGFSESVVMMGKEQRGLDFGGWRNYGC
jgi:hypothetical protein